MRKLGNGVLKAAVLKVFTEADSPMRLPEVQRAVEALLGQSVSQSSVKWCLVSGVRGEKPRFQRVARGRYALVQHK